MFLPDGIPVTSHHQHGGADLPQRIKRNMGLIGHQLQSPPLQSNRGSSGYILTSSISCGNTGRGIPPTILAPDAKQLPTFLWDI